MEKIFLDSSDIKAARDFLCSIGAQLERIFFISDFKSRAHVLVSSWMLVSLVSYSEEIDIKDEAEKPRLSP
jgi:hypothetical protein